MKNWIIGVIVVAAALALGIGGAYAAGKYIDTQAAYPAQGSSFQAPILPNQPGQRFWNENDKRGYPGRDFGEGMMPGRGGRNGFEYGPGMMDGRGWNANPKNAVRISIDDAAAKAQEFASSVDDSLKVSEIMEFQKNFYAVVVEKDGHGAFELLINPYSGKVSYEIGPNMMWNEKYGHMGSGNPVANKLTLKDAQAAAQKALDAKVSGAKVAEDGITFYGYYTFDYSIGGKVAGMLSVNGQDGRVWFHTWHGDFISEKELE